MAFYAWVDSYSKEKVFNLDSRNEVVHILNMPCKTSKLKRSENIACSLSEAFQKLMQKKLNLDDLNWELLKIQELRFI